MYEDKLLERVEALIDLGWVIAQDTVDREEVLFGLSIMERALNMKVILRGSK